MQSQDLLLLPSSSKKLHRRKNLGNLLPSQDRGAGATIINKIYKKIMHLIKEYKLIYT